MQNKKAIHNSLTLVGDGPDRAHLESLVQEFGIDELVTLAGFQSNSAVLLRNHRAYVHTASIENLPISLLEAMASNLPILAGAVGGIPEIFDNGVEGFYWPLDNSDSAAEILIRLMENQEVYERLVQATERRFIKQFETNNVATQLVSFLRA